MISMKTSLYGVKIAFLKQSTNSALLAFAELMEINATVTTWMIHLLINFTLSIHSDS